MERFFQKSDYGTTNQLTNHPTTPEYIYLKVRTSVENFSGINFPKKGKVLCCSPKAMRKVVITLILFSRMRKIVPRVAFLLETCLISIITARDKDMRCKIAPHWVVEGRNPILEHASNGNVVVLALISTKGRKYLRYSLDALNNYGQYYT